VNEEMIDAIKIATSEQPSPPCETYLCPRFNDCRDQKLACESFAWYVTNGDVIPPYKRAVSDRITWKIILETVPIAPSRRIFNKIHQESNGD